MLIAIELAPQSRFVLRSASRLAVHLDDAEWGHDLLRRSPRTAVDPWLASAEIATAALSERPSRLIKSGRRMLESARFSKRDTAELAAALATREMHASRRRSKRLFLEALEDPTENAVAQAAWAASAMNWQDIDFDLAFANQPESFEARARTLATAGDRVAAVSESWAWFRDEPFATEPPMFGSYYASADEDYAAGFELVLEGLRANPDDAGLLNNAAFCLASDGDVERARRFFGRIRPAGLDDEFRAAYTATRGLLHYRAGELEAGRRDYTSALELAKDPSRRALAAIMFAREEMRANTPAGLDAARRALELERVAEEQGGIVARDLRAWFRHVEQLMREHPQVS
jgi:tetratricopeptide (TPR) repeat protein